MNEEYLPCVKRQNEIFKGDERQRCIEKSAETYREFVAPSACESCPVRKLLPTKPQIGKKASEEIAQKGNLIQLPVINNPTGDYPECIYRLCNDDACVCSVTNLPVDPAICNRCDEDVREQTAGGLTKLQNYWGAVRQWIAHGRPVRSDEQMKKIFEEHCKGCDRYDPENHSCKVCGCKVSTDSTPLKNKLRMATEACPLGRFPADVQ